MRAKRTMRAFMLRFNVFDAQQNLLGYVRAKTLEKAVRRAKHRFGRRFSKLVEESAS